MPAFTPWIADCHLQQIEGEGEFRCQAAVWSDSHGTFKARLEAHLLGGGYKVLWLEECLPVPQYIARHGQQKVGALARAVHPGHLVDLSQMVALDNGKSKEPESYLIIEEIEDVEPLDSQFGAHPMKCVPDALKEPLFGQPDPTEAEIEHYGGAENVPLMKTYLIADVFHFPQWEREASDLVVPNKCFFQGDAKLQLSDTAPHLIELSETDDFTRKLFTFLKNFQATATVHHWHRPYGIFVRSRESFETIYSHFRRFTKLQDENGKWFFRRFWDAKHSYVLLPLLSSDLMISGRFFGHTRGSMVPIVRTISVLLGEYNSFRSAKWDESAFIDQRVNARLPNSRTQYLDTAYVDMINQAAVGVSSLKVVDYLLEEFKEPNQIGDGSRLVIEEFSRQVQESTQPLGVVSELGWARVANVSAHLGAGFLNDPRFDSRGLSFEKVGQDSQGEKIFFLGNECIKQMQEIRSDFPDFSPNEANQSIDQSAAPPQDLTLEMLAFIDPNAEWYWGDKPLRRWCNLFVKTLGRDVARSGKLCEHVAVAYMYGLDFQTDPRYLFHIQLKNITDGEYTQAISDIFDKEFGRD